MSQAIRFNNRKQPDFIQVLRQRVNDHFKSNNKSQQGNALMWTKVVFYVGGLVASYLLLILGSFSIPVQFLLWAGIGLFSAFIGLNVCHDAIHGTISKNKHVNKALSMLFNIVGANAYMWSIMHNVVHHTYTNIEGHDEDIESVPFLRLSPHKPLKKVHRYQHWFAFPLYGFASISWVFGKDYVKFFKPEIGGSWKNKKHPRVEYFNLFFFKALYYTLFLVIPLVVISAPWWVILLGFFLSHLLEGYTLAITFMLAHVVEETQFPLPDQKGKVENAWAVHQLVTTANFACDSKFVSFVCGGLNFQVEHHLFPKICHVHYPALRNIVKQTAEEYNLPYNEQPTYMGAIRSHLRFLKRLGREEAPVYSHASSSKEAAEAA